MDDELLERQIRQRAAGGDSQFAIAWALLQVAAQLERCASSPRPTTKKPTKPKPEHVDPKLQIIG